MTERHLQDPTREQLMRELDELRAREASLRAMVEGEEADAGERRFRALFDQSSEFGAVLDRDGTVVLLNQTARNVLVEGDDSVTGMLFWETPWWSHSAPMRARVRDGVERAAAGETVRLETHDVDRGGQEHTVDAVFCPIRDDRGEVTHVLALGRDVTDLVRTRRTLAASERRYRTLFEHAPEAITVLDMETGRFVDVNQQACELFGLSRDELLASTPADLSPPTQPDGRSSAEAAAAVLGRAAAGEAPQFEWVHVDAEGRRIPCEIHLVRLPSTEGTLIRGATFDISERKAAEHALRQSEERYATLIANLPSVVWATDRDGDTTFISPNVASVYGYTAEEILAAGPALWFGRIHPDDVERVRAAYDALFEHEGAAFDVEYRIRRKDGEWIWVHDSASATLERDGGDLVAYGVFSDITAQKKAEADLMEAEAQLRQSQKLEAIGRLAGGVAHDFNNLLTIINGHSEMAVEALSDDDALTADIEMVLEAGQRAAALTRQLLAFSRQQVLEPRVLDLNEVVTSVEKMLGRVIGEHIELTTVLDDDLGPVRADPGQIEQVLVNLAVNSRDAMPQGGELTIRTANVELDEAGAANAGVPAPGPHVRLSVSDTGTGIPPEDRERIFEPFFTTKAEGRGTGLGLATVFGIVAQSGGHIRVASEVDTGTTFHLYLPRAEAGRDPAAAPEPARGEVGGDETILVAEDDDAVRGLVSRILGSAGYHVITASGGHDAVRECEGRGEEIDLLLTDVVMPGMGGKELADRLGSDYPGLRIIFMTGYTDDVSLRRGVLEEGVHLLHKPFEPRQLLRTLRTVLDEG